MYLHCTLYTVHLHRNLVQLNVFRKIKQVLYYKPYNYIYTHSCIHTNHTHTRARTHTHTHTHIHTHIHTYIHTHTHTHKYTHTYIYIIRIKHIYTLLNCIVETYWSTRNVTIFSMTSNKIVCCSQNFGYLAYQHVGPL